MRRGVPEETSIGEADLYACAKEGQTKKNVRYNCTNTPSIQQDQVELWDSAVNIKLVIWHICHIFHWRDDH